MPSNKLFTEATILQVSETGFQLGWQTSAPIGFGAIRVYDCISRKFLEPRKTPYIEYVNDQYVKYNSGDPVEHYFELISYGKYQVYLVGCQEDGSFSIPVKVDVEMPIHKRAFLVNQKPSLIFRIFTWIFKKWFRI